MSNRAVERADPPLEDWRNALLFSGTDFLAQGPEGTLNGDFPCARRSAKPTPAKKI